jgi:nitrogen fixation protein NifB
MNSSAGEVKAASEKHPCFSCAAHHKYARLHLPIAPKCNVQCNYCNRKFDCVNESRPGVTSELLDPDEALEKFLWVRQEIAALSVVGIAGPGEALANWEATRESLEKIRQADKQVIFCLSSNGLLLPKYAHELLELGVFHVTVTLNAVDSGIGARLYQYVNFDGQCYSGEEGASILLANQLEGIACLTGHGAVVKINIVMVKGINDRHIPLVVRRAKALGAQVTNIMPLLPAPGSNFENFPQTGMKELTFLRNQCELILPQMRHCKQCRADAVGLLGEDRSAEFRLRNRNDVQTMKTPAENTVSKAGQAYRIAVATRSARAVDLHFGHTELFHIYDGDGSSFALIGQRAMTRYCAGKDDCFADETHRNNSLSVLGDCDAVLCLRIGYEAKERLKNLGIAAVESCDAVEDALKYAAGRLKSCASGRAGGSTAIARKTGNSYYS